MPGQFQNSCYFSFQGFHKNKLLFLKSMRNFIEKLVAAFAVIAVAAQPCYSQSIVRATDNAAFPTKKTAGGPRTFKLANSTLTATDTPATKPKQESQVEKTTASRKAKPRKALAMADVVGGGVMTYETLSSSTPSGGLSVDVTKAADDSIAISNFYTQGVTIKAKVDFANSTISIPCQSIGTIDGKGYSIAVTSIVGNPDRDATIEGKILADGSLSITTPWGFFQDGTTRTRLTINEKTEIEKANAVMKAEMTDGSSAKVWNVVATQQGANLVTIKNFGNHGCTIDIVLSHSGTATIAQQVGWKGTSHGNFYTVAMDWAQNKVAGGTISGKLADNTISWGNWTMLTTDSYVTGKYANGSISSDKVTFKLPDDAATSLDGEGTEANPYKVRTLKDLNYIADAVNSDKELKYGDPDVSLHTKTFLGKYFRLENDIDMTNYRFEPIGNYWTQRFAGTFDGNGHKLIGLNVNTRSAGFAGLFGVADTASVIKNLVVEKATVSGEYYYSGIIASASFGLVENCTTSGTVTNTGVCAAGIVAYANDIKNCYFNGTVYALGGNGGGIAGQLNGVADNCHARATVFVSGSTSGRPAGGLVGNVYGSKAMLSHSYFTGKVNGTIKDDMHVGGVAGEVVLGTVDGCFAAADVTGLSSEACVGGVVGYLRGNVSNCYFTGLSSCYNSKKVGGITGFISATLSGKGDTIQASVKNCYFAGRIRADVFLYDPQTGARETLGTVYEAVHPTVENVYYDRQMLNYNSVQGKATTAELTSADGPKGFSADKWVFTKGYYPRIKGLENTPEAQLSATALIMDPSFPDNTERVANDFAINALGNTKAYILKGYETDNAKITTKGECGTISDNTYKLNGTFGADTVAIVAMDAKGNMDGNIAPRIYNLKVAPKVFEGSGSQTDPYLIKTKADLIKLSEVTSKIRQFYNDTYFLQTADIDLEHDEAFTGLCTGDDKTDKFQGHYDGGGHTIDNMKLNFVVWDTPPSGNKYGSLGDNNIYKGFIGVLAKQGSVSNLTIGAGSDLQFTGYAGAFVGYCYGKVINCKNYAKITNYTSTTGGIVGSSLAGSEIRGCFNAGEVLGGTTNVGGIVGTAVGVIENCQNVGWVETKKLSTRSPGRIVGGIAGSANGTTITNVVNAGHVQSAVESAGGIVGQQISGDNVISGAVNYGTVFSVKGTKTGAIAGDYKTNGKVENVYFDAQSTGLKAAANDGSLKMSSVKTADFTSGKALKGLSADVWQFEANRYPILKQFAADTLVKESSSAIITLAAAENVKQMSTNATLASADGLTWALSQGNNFSIDGNTLSVPKTDSGVLRDTLTVSAGGYVKPIALAAVRKINLNGEGTEANPYQIATTADWSEVGKYMTETGSSLDGIYLKVINDISFADTTFVPLASDATTAFCGTLLGNGKTISGLNATTKVKYFAAIMNVGTGGLISDLTLDGKFTSTADYVAGFVGNNNGTIANCVNKVNIVSDRSYAAGFAAQAGSNAKFINCRNLATISNSSSYEAGILAYNNVSGVELIDCTNEGEIKNSGSRSQYVAGLVGYSQGISHTRSVNKADVSNPANYCTAGVQAFVQGADSVKFVDCHNEGNITSGDNAAGILASTQSSTNKAPIRATGCYNTGDISTSLSKSVHGVAGLFGLLNPGSYIADCYNTGNILSEKSVYTGGIWGEGNDASADKQVIVKRCYNKGSVIGANYGGGIAGSVPAYATLDSCYNVAEVSAKFGAGGITGAVMGEYVNIFNSWNSGDVTTSENGAGGINGYGNYYAHVTNCFNTGNVNAGTNNAGGLGGQGRVTYTNCYNTGNVNAAKNAGGLLGEPSTESNIGPGSQLYACYNAGKVTCDDAATLGTVIGAKDMFSAAHGNKAEDVFFVTDYGKTDIDTIGEGLSMAALAALDVQPTEKAEGDEEYGYDPHAAGWNYGDKYTLPMIPSLINDCAKAHAAALVLADGDTYANVVSGDMHVGLPDGVTWSATSDVVAFDGSRAFVTKASTDKVTLVATCGDFAGKWNITLNTSTGVEGNLAQKPVASRDYYTVAGVKVSKPSNHDGQVYIEVTTYSDGTTATAKVQDK